MVGEGITVFVTTHYMDEAEYCNRLVLDRSRAHRGHGYAHRTSRAATMKGQLLLMECEPLGPALEALLQTAPAVLDAAVFGSALHAAVADAVAWRPEFARRSSPAD